VWNISYLDLGSGTFGHCYLVKDWGKALRNVEGKETGNGKIAVVKSIPFHSTNEIFEAAKEIQVGSHF
jgi:hypothetical protein